MLGCENMGEFFCDSAVKYLFDNSAQTSQEPSTMSTQKLGAFACLLLCCTLASPLARAAALFSHDYDIEGFGGSTAQIFSTGFAVNEVWNLDSVSIDVTHEYAAELELSLTSPGAEVFNLLSRNGYRTRVGDGSGTLGGVETYTLIESGAPLGSVTGWDFTGYRAGGTYDALEWPSGILNPGVWTIALRNVDVSGSGGGALGNVTVTGHVVPEPQTSHLALAAICAWFACRWRGQTKDKQRGHSTLIGGSRGESKRGRS
jgi:hypothetical protein